MDVYEILLITTFASHGHIYGLWSVKVSYYFSSASPAGNRAYSGVWYWDMFGTYKDYQVTKIERQNRRTKGCLSDFPCHRLLPHDFCSSRMKNRDGHRVHWCRRVERTVAQERCNVKTNTQD